MKQTLLFLFCLSSLSSFAQNISLDLNPNLKNQMNLSESPEGTYTIKTLGGDPWIITYPVEQTYDPEQVYVISFDYVAVNGLDNLQVFYGSPLDAMNRRKDFGSLQATAEYTSFKAFMKYEVSNWNTFYDRFRFDFGKASGQEIIIKNLEVRAPLPGEVIPLSLDTNRKNQMNITEDSEDLYTINTLGNDPYIFSKEQLVNYDPQKTFVIAFDYTSSTGLDDLQIFYGSPISAQRRALLGSLPVAGSKTTFKAFMNISAPVWNDTYDIFRFDFGRLPNLDIQISDLVLREPTNQEKKLLEIKETVNLELDVAGTSPDLTATENSKGSYVLTTSDNDPWIRSQPVEVRYDIDQSYILEFEYKTEQAYNELEIFYGPPITGTQKMSAGEIPAASDWSKFTINPRLLVDNFQDENWTLFRFDFGKNEYEEKSIEIRSLKIRKPTIQELETEQNSDKFVSRALNQEFIEYLNTDFANEISQVKLDESKVNINGKVEGNSENLFVAEIDPFEYGFDSKSFKFPTPVNIENHSFNIEFSRFVEKPDRQYDRLYSRWALVEKTAEDNYKLVSPLKWANHIAGIAINNLSEEKASSIKGLDGLTPSTLSNFGDLIDLNISSMKINLLLNGVFSLNDSGMTHEFNGKVYNINPNFVTNMDDRIQRTTEAGIKTAFVLLIPYLENPELARIFDHPDAYLGNYSMANVATEEGVEYYTAMVDFLARRYSRPDEKYGKVDQWIIHNEVDAHTNWTHAGQKPVELYTHIYDRSMRLVYYTIRKYNPTAKVFGSFTKHWNSFAGTSANFKSKDILDTEVTLTNKEGDYEWNIAWHSYPTNLFNPEVWNDPLAQTQFNFDTPQITPRNLEMIDAYVRKERVLYNGKKVRTILLSENGFNSNSGSNANANETTQAAALAYFWKKANKRLPSIENIQLHRWVDNPNEAGINFGLWTVLDGTFDGFDEKKEGWYIWEAAGSSRENVVFDPYKDIIGISDWSEIYQDVTTEVTPYKVQMNIEGCDADLSDFLVSFNGEYKAPQQDGTLNFYNVASNVEQPYKIYKGDFIFDSGVLNVNENMTLSINLRAIENVTAKGISPSEITIAWESNVTGIEGFSIEVKEENGTYQELDQVEPNVFSYTHAGVIAGKRYTYRVAAVYNVDNKSCFSEEADVIAPFLLVDYKDGDKNKTANNKIRPHLILRNEAESSVDLSRATIRYWFTSENSPGMRFKVDEAGIYSVEDVYGTFTKLDSPLNMADTYLEIGFEENNFLNALTNSDEIKIKIENDMPSEFNELNDYSFIENENYLQTENITVYWDNELIWGEEPNEPATDEKDLANEDSNILAVYPNPTHSYTTIKWKNEIFSVTKLQLIDYNRNIENATLESLNFDEATIRLPQVAPGIYLLRGTVNGVEFTHRLLVQ